jgi:hypothetical protein
MRAFRGFSYSLDQIRSQLESGKIPFAFATKRSEKSQMKYQGRLSAAGNLNKRGWKLCHIDGAGLRAATLLEDFSSERLVRHFPTPTQAWQSLFGATLLGGLSRAARSD